MTVKDVPTDPFELFKLWYADAAGICPPDSTLLDRIFFLIKKVLRTWVAIIYPPISMHQPDAMVIATADSKGQPSARMVLLKDFNEKGLVFYTNYNSRKGQDMEVNPHVSALFHWGQPERQVRIEGVVEKVSYQESAAYWDTRGRGSQISGYASPQSEKIISKDFLREEVLRVDEEFTGNKVVCPKHWGGYILIPEKVEYWQGQANRFHDRILYEKIAGEWKKSLLAP